MPETITVKGLDEFSRNLKRLDSDLPKALRVGLNQAVDIVVGYARPRIPKRSGRAARSLKARSTQKAARITGGGSRAPYYPWLDFGGRVGRARSVERAFLKDGRYIYAGYFAKRTELLAGVEKALLKVAEQAGIEVE